MDKKDKLNENDIQASLDLKPDEDYLCFSEMGGAGIIECEDCGYTEHITCFTHGFSSCEIGRQCPHCLSFVTEYNESGEHHAFESKEDFICPNCGKVIRKKEEDFLTGNDDPLFCPKCHSARLRYIMNYIT